MRSSTQISALGLRLIACTLTHVEAELEAPETLAALLGVGPISHNWPPGDYDREAQCFFRDRLREGGKAAVGWYGWYGVVPEQPVEGIRTAPEGSGQPVLVGACGYFGPPDETGGVALGYSVLPEWTGQGLATGMAALLVEHAFSFPVVTQITAETTRQNIASQKVLRKVGFLLQPAEPGTDMLHYILPRRA